MQKKGLLLDFVESNHDLSRQARDKHKEAQGMWATGGRPLANQSRQVRKTRCSI